MQFVRKSIHDWHNDVAMFYIGNSGLHMHVFDVVRVRLELHERQVDIESRSHVTHVGIQLCWQIRAPIDGRE